MALAAPGLVVVLVAANVRGIAGQEVLPFGEVPVIVHRLGSATFAPTAVLKDIGFDSNVYNSTTASRPDFTFTARPAVDATARVRRLRLASSSAVEFVYFARESSERSLNGDVAATARLPFRRVSVGGTVSYRNTRERPNEEIDVRSRRMERSERLDAQVAIGPRLTAGVDAEIARTAFDGAAEFEKVLLGDVLNRDTQTVTGTLRYRLTPLTTIVGSVARAENRFDEETVRNSDERQVRVGVELHPRALVSGSANLGVQRFRPRDPLLPAFDGLIGNGSVSYRLNPAMSIGVSYDRNVYYSYSEVAPYYVRTGLGLQLRRQLAARWDVQVGGSRFVHDYRSLPAAGADAVPAPRQRVLDAAVSFGYQPRRGMRTIVTLAAGERHGNDVGRDYRDLRLLTTVMYGL